MLFIKASMSSFLASEILTIGRPTLGGLKGWDDPGRHFFGIFWGCLTYIYPIELKNPLGSTWGGVMNMCFLLSPVCQVFWLVRHQNMNFLFPKDTRVPQTFTRFGLVPFLDLISNQNLVNKQIKH